MTSTPSTSPAPWTYAERWGARGHVTDLGGPVHWVSWPARRPAPGAEPLVLVHGLGGSHLNWALVGGPLSETRDVYALDLAGFGLTPGAERDTSVEANADLVIRFVTQVVGSAGVLVGNSMGGLISTIVARRRPDLVTALVLLDPALPITGVRHDRQVAARFALMAIPMLGEATMRLSRQRHGMEKMAHDMVRLCFAHPERADVAMLEESARLGEARLEQGPVDAPFMGAARSLMRALAGRGRFWSGLEEISQPVLLIHGEHDRLVSVAAARMAARRLPTWRTVVLPEVGHTPQLEVPEQTVGLIEAFLTEDAGPGTVSA